MFAYDCKLQDIYPIPSLTMTPWISLVSKTLRGPKFIDLARPISISSHDERPVIPSTWGGFGWIGPCSTGAQSSAGCPSYFGELL